MTQRRVRIAGRYGLPLLLCLLATMPLLFVPIAPFVDVPGHIGRYAIQTALADDAQLRHWYSFDWQIVGNMIVDLLVQLLHEPLGLIGSVKAIVIAIPVLFIVGAAAISNVVHARLTFPAIVACTLSWHRFFIFGFLNYAMGLALGLIGYALWRSLHKRGARCGATAAIFLFAVLTFLSHMAAWMVFAVAVGATLLAGAIWTPASKRLSERFGQLVRSCLVLLLPMIANLLLSPPGEGLQIEKWGKLKHKFEAAYSIFADHFFFWDIAAACLVGALIVWMIVSRGFRADRGLALTAGILSAITIALPPSALGGTYVDARIAPMATFFALIAFRPVSVHGGSKANMLYGPALAFFAARMVGHLLSVGTLWQQWEDKLVIFDIMPRHSSVASFAPKTCDRPHSWNRGMMHHFTGLHIAFNHGYSNDQWAIAGQQMLRLKHSPGDNMFVALDPQQIVDARCPGKVKKPRRPFPLLVGSIAPGSYDYVFTTDLPDARAYNSALTPVWRGHGSVLYRVAR